MERQRGVGARSDGGNSPPRQGKKVVVFVADDGSAESDASRVAEQLRWHVTDVEARCLAPGRDGTAASIARAAAAEGADLLVAGGYGHSRAREYTLGGVTRDLLESCPLPLLLAH